MTWLLPAITNLLSSLVQREYVETQLALARSRDAKITLVGYQASDHGRGASAAVLDESQS